MAEVDGRENGVGLRGGKREAERPHSVLQFFNLYESDVVDFHVSHGDSLWRSNPKIWWHSCSDSMPWIYVVLIIAVIRLRSHWYS